MLREAIYLMTLVIFLFPGHFAQAGGDLESLRSMGFKITYDFGQKDKRYTKLFQGMTLESTLGQCFGDPNTYNSECVRQANFYGWGFKVTNSSRSVEGNMCVTTSKTSGSTFYGRTPQEVIKNCKVKSLNNDVECEQNLNRGCKECAAVIAENSQIYYIFTESFSNIKTYCETYDGDFSNPLCKAAYGSTFQKPCRF